MKKTLLLMSLFFLCGCAASVAEYKIRLVDSAKGWAVYRGGFLIPEFTATREGVYARDESTARDLFNLRQKGLEPFLAAKYKNESATEALLGPVSTPGAPPIPALRESWPKNTEAQRKLEYYLWQTEIEYDGQKNYKSDPSDAR